MKNFNVIAFVLVVLLLAGMYFMKIKHKEQLTEFCKIAYQQGIKDGKQFHIEDNINHEVMNKSGKWLNEFKLAGEK